MPSFYSGLAKTADSLIKKFGVEATHRTKSNETLNPVTGVKSGGAERSQKVSIVFVDNAVSKDGNVEENMRTIYMSAKKTNGEALAFTPAPDDTITYDSVKWYINGVTPLSPAGADLIYQCAVRI